MQQQTETTFEEKKNKFHCWWHFVQWHFVRTPLSDALCVDHNVIGRVYSFTLFGIVGLLQCNLKWTAHVDQTILVVVYNQSRTTKQHFGERKASTLYLNLQLLLLKVSKDFQSDA